MSDFPHDLTVVVLVVLVVAVCVVVKVVAKPLLRLLGRQPPPGPPKPPPGPSLAPPEPPRGLLTHGLRSNFNSRYFNSRKLLQFFEHNSAPRPRIRSTLGQIKVTGLPELFKHHMSF